jgi:hypothetical protein
MPSRLGVAAVALVVSPPDKFSVEDYYAVIALGAALGAAFGRWIAAQKSFVRP